MTSIEPFTGRFGIDIHRCRFHLDPTPREFTRFFAGLHGAAFIAYGGHVAFGAGADGSIDHPSVGRQFGLGGDERFRGYMRADRQTQLEIWVKAEDEALLSADERTRIDAIIADFTSDRIMARLMTDPELVVFSLEHGQAIVERPIAQWTSTRADQTAFAA